MINKYPEVGTSIDILRLRELREELHIFIYLYFDAEIAQSSDLLTDLTKYRLVDLDMRPVLEIEEFLKHMQKQMKQIMGSNVNIDQMLTEEPLSATIFSVNDKVCIGGRCGYIKALMPYLDEMEEIEYSKATSFKSAK